MMDNGYQTQEMNISTDTAISRFLRQRLQEMELKPTKFCQLEGFDQGLLSKLMNSRLNTVNLETALKLAIGLRVPPAKIFALFGRKAEWSGLIEKALAVEE